MMFPYSQANAELLKNFKLSGQLDVQTQSSRNISDFVTRQPVGSAGTAVASGDKSWNDRLNDAQTRVLLHLDWDLLDDVHAKVTLRKNDRTYGTTGGTTGANGGQTLTTVGGANVLGNVVVDQAYVKVLKMLGSVDTTWGRQFYGNPGDLVVYYGPSDKAFYGLPSSAVDAVRADWMGEMFSVTGIAGKTTGSLIGVVAAQPAASGTPWTVSVTPTNVDLRGLTLGAKFMEGFNLNAYVYNRVGHSNAAFGTDLDQGKNDNLYVFGAKAKYEAMGLSFGLEFAKNRGENRLFRASDVDADGTNDATAASADKRLPAVATYNGYAWKLDAAYKAELEGVAAVTPWILFGWGTGRGNLNENKNEDFQAVNGDFRPGALYGRFATGGSMRLASGVPCRAGLPGCANTTGLLAGGISPNTLTNRVIWGWGLKVNPAALNQLTMGVSWYSFHFQRLTHSQAAGIPAAGVDAGVAGGTNSSTFGIGRDQRHIGTELDFDAAWKHSENVSLMAGVAGFNPGKYLQEIARDSHTGTVATETGISPARIAYADLRIKF